MRGCCCCCCRGSAAGAPAAAVDIGTLLGRREKSLSVLQLSAFCADKCGGEIEIRSGNYLTSPGYPSAYPSSQQCVWVITAPEPGQKILINFNPHFDLEDRDCK